MSERVDVAAIAAQWGIVASQPCWCVFGDGAIVVQATVRYVCKCEGLPYDFVKPYLVGIRFIDPFVYTNPSILTDELLGMHVFSTYADALNCANAK